MGLSEEERKRIYEEEQERRKAQKAIKRKGCLRRLLILGGLIFFFVVMWKVGQKARNRALRNPRIQEALAREKRYAHNSVNIRSAPSTKAMIAKILERGDKVSIDSVVGNWAVAYDGMDRLGYVYLPVLKRNPWQPPPPPPPFKIVSWNWTFDRDFGSDGAVIWNVQVKNQTARYVEHVRVEFTTLDVRGNIITTDFGYVSGLAPGAVGATKGYATYFGTEHKASIRVIP